jgi:secondary thiamine-phosphate synthase enzyme
MRTHRAECRATTSGAFDFVDITDEVSSALESSRISDGQVTVFVSDSSSTLLLNEHEAGFFSDLRGTMRRLESTRSDGKALLGSASVVLPAVGGALRLGVWQRLMLVELDEPGPHDLVVQVVGE